MALEVVNRMIEQRARDWNEAEALITTAKAEARLLTAEEQERYTKLVADVDNASAVIDAEDARETEHAKRASKMNEVRTETRVLPGGDRVRERRVNPRSTEEYHETFDLFLRGGMSALDSEQRSLMQAARGPWSIEPGNGEQRAAQTVSTTGGGYLIPTGFQSKLVSEMLKFGNVRGVATVFETADGGTLNLPTIADTSNVGAILAINTQIGEQAFTVGQTQFTSYVYTSKLILVPWQLMQDSAFDMEDLIGRIAAERLGRITNTHFTTGDNSGKPQGIVAGASSALTAAGTTTVTYAELLSLVHSIDPAYRESGASFMFNDGTLLKLRQMTDDVSRPLWQPGLVSGEPNTLLGYPYQVNQDVAAMTTGLKPVVFGNMSYYHIRDVVGIQMVRMDERYADYLQTGFFMYLRTDGRVVDPGVDPIKYITMA